MPRTLPPKLMSDGPKSQGTNSRRNFLKLAGAGALMVPVGLAMPRISRAATRPLVTHGLQSGDIGTNHGVIWARTDRPARAIFEVATTEGFRTPARCPMSTCCRRATTSPSCWPRICRPARTSSIA